MLSPVVEKRIEKLEALADELDLVLKEHGWTAYAFKILSKMRVLVAVLNDESVDAEECLHDIIMEFRQDAGNMFDAFKDAYQDKWITTENGHKIHISEEGEPDKGNPYVLEAISDGIEKKETEEKAKKEAEEAEKAKAQESEKKRQEHPRKDDMICEDKVEFENSGAITKDSKGKLVTHFNHDEDIMQVTRQIKEVGSSDGNFYKVCRGIIEHLTVFASAKVGRGVDVEQKLIGQVGGSAGSWKHVKGIGTVVDKEGNQRKADLHWFESPECGQVRWKIKQFAEDMDESKVYW